LQVLSRSFFIATVIAWTMPVQAIEIETPPVGLKSVPVEVVVSDVAPGAEVRLRISDSVYNVIADADGNAAFNDWSTDAGGNFAISATADGHVAAAEVRVLPGWVSLLPAFAAILVALLIRNVVPALLLGLWLGSTTLLGFSSLGVLQGLMNVLTVYVVNALADSDHVAIIVFTMMIGGMVGIITRNGGMASIVRVVVSKAKTAVGGQVAVWLMGLMIFFDDYANTLVVGNTARSVTDHLKISLQIT
jgi:hypothetical protein